MSLLLSCLWLDTALQTLHLQTVGDFLILFPLYLRQVYLSILALVWELAFYVMSTFLKSEEMLGLWWGWGCAVYLNKISRVYSPLRFCLSVLSQGSNFGIAKLHRSPDFWADSATWSISPFFTWSSLATISCSKRARKQWYPLSLLLSRFGAISENSQNFTHMVSVGACCFCVSVLSLLGDTPYLVWLPVAQISYYYFFSLKKTLFFLLKGRKFSDISIGNLNQMTKIICFARGPLGDIKWELLFNAT